MDAGHFLLNAPTSVPPQPCNNSHLHCKVRLMINGCYVTPRLTPYNGGEIKLSVEDTQYEGKPVSLETCERDGIKYMAFSFEHESGSYRLKRDGGNLKLEKSSADPLSCSANLLFEKKDVGAGEGHGLKAGDMSLCLDSRTFLKLSTTDPDPLVFRTEELPNS